MPQRPPITLFEEHFDDEAQFPIAAGAKLGHVSVDPDSNQVTGKLAAPHFYQLSLPPRTIVDRARLESALG